jgi:predicted GNAT family N-acyltransferase
VRRVAWQRDGDTLQQIRRSVFVVEQGIPDELEWDDQDAGAGHLSAFDLQRMILRK